MGRHETATLRLGLLAFCAGVVVLMLALALGISFEGLPSDAVDSAKGQLVAVPGVIALVAGVVALNGRRRGWGLAVGCVGAAAGVVALLLFALLPGGQS